MNDVRTKTQAGAPAAGGERLARVVRQGVVAFALACTAAGAMAAGQERSQRREELQQQAMRERYESRAQDQRFDQRVYEMREEARLRQEQQIQREREEGGHRSRMTPDERSDLRRQINEANRDLYPNARRR